MYYNPQQSVITPGKIAKTLNTVEYITEDSSISVGSVFEWITKETE